MEFKIIGEELLIEFQLVVYQNLKVCLVHIWIKSFP